MVFNENYTIRAGRLTKAYPLSDRINFLNRFKAFVADNSMFRCLSNLNQNFWVDIL